MTDQELMLLQLQAQQHAASEEDERRRSLLRKDDRALDQAIFDDVTRVLLAWEGVSPEILQDADALRELVHNKLGIFSWTAEKPTQYAFSPEPAIFRAKAAALFHVVYQWINAAREGPWEMCAQIAESEKVNADETGEPTDAAYNAACDHIAAQIRAHRRDT